MSGSERENKQVGKVRIEVHIIKLTDLAQVVCPKKHVQLCYIPCTCSKHFTVLTHLILMYLYFIRMNQID